MPVFAANLSMLYPEHDFLKRFEAARNDGFTAVEYLFPYAHTAQEIKQLLDEQQLKQVLFNAPPGDWDNGERGMACHPGHSQEFQDSIGKALEYAKVLGCSQVHVMAGLKPQGVGQELLDKTYIENLTYAAQEAAKVNVDILIEPINTRDMPGFYLNYQEQAHQIVQTVGLKNIKVQMDLYHCQIMEGDLSKKIEHYLPTGRVGHIQIAGVPTRNEPNIGELHYPYLFNLIDKLGFKGHIGCEYKPLRGNEPNGTSLGLDWLKNYQASR